MKKNQIDSSSWKKDILLLVVILMPLYLFLLGDRPLSTPDEGRYAEIPREMLVSGDYITPRLNGLKYFEKPPLVYWLQSFVIKAVGVEPFFLRLLTVFFSLFGCVLVYGAGRFLYHREAGLVGAFVLGSSLLYYTLSRIIILDMPVSFFMTAALLAYLCAVHAKNHLQTYLLIGFYGAMAGAVLTKGLIGVVLPGGIILSWACLARRWKDLGLAFKWWGMALFFLLAAPWHILVSLKNPDFFDFYFIHEHFTRFLTKAHGRYKPIWFFIPVLLAGFFPWISFLWGALKTSWKNDGHRDRNLFLILWALIVFLFFSFSHSKLVPYILPVLPPLALLVGNFICSEALKDYWKSAIRTAVVLSILFGVVGFSYNFIALPGTDIYNHPGVLILSALFVVMGLGSYVLRSQVKAALVFLTFYPFLIFSVASYFAPHLEPRTSISPLVHFYRSLAREGDRIVSYKTYFQDLPPYLGRTVQIVGWHGELEFGMKAEPHQKQIISQKDFESLIKEKVFIFTKLENVPELEKYGFKVLKTTEQQALLVNDVSSRSH